MKSKPKSRQKEIFSKAASMLRKHGAKQVGVFGSFSRGDNKPKSDLDILVEFQPRKSLLEMVGIEQELSEDLGIKVDLLTEKSISPYLIERIKRELVVVYP